MAFTLPAHLPRKLTISLWDFTWYTMNQEGEPFADLEQAFAEAVERGYNTVRICAMPYLLFGPEAKPDDVLQIANLGGDFGQRTRWYNVQGGAVLNGRAHLLRLFEAAKKHDCFIILSSWEYQQSPCFAQDDSWYQKLIAIAPQDRFMAQAKAMMALIQFLKEHQLADRIAYTELHNETEVSKLKDVTASGEDTYAAVKPYQEAAIEYMRKQHPDILMTTCYAVPPVGNMQDLPENAQVAHFHLYVYGVLKELFDELKIWSSETTFSDLARSLLRSDTPAFEEWKPAEEWRLAATGISRRLFYFHDWVDPDKWDLWLYENYARYRDSMRETMQQRLTAITNWAEQKSVPAVIGEGYVGYTPLLTNFEEGPVGKDVAEYAIALSQRLNFWGYILCSNSAPHHPFWQDVAWQKRLNAVILQA